MRRRNTSNILLILLVMLCCVGCDQVTKHYARERLASGTHGFWGDILVLRYAENTGAAMSFGSSFPPRIRFGLFVVGAGLMLLAALILLLTRPSIRLIPVISFSMIIGGGIGNLIDRIANAGHVIDFIIINVAGHQTGIFNAADAAITAGTILLLLDLIVRQFLRPTTGTEHTE